jgi:hypothetical protein
MAVKKTSKIKIDSDHHATMDKTVYTDEAGDVVDYRNFIKVNDEGILVKNKDDGEFYITPSSTGINNIVVIDTFDDLPESDVLDNVLYLTKDKHELYETEDGGLNWNIINNITIDYADYTNNTDGIVKPESDDIIINDGVINFKDDKFRNRLVEAIYTREIIDYNGVEVNNIINNENLPAFWGDGQITPYAKRNNKLYFGASNIGNTDDTRRIGIFNNNTGSFTLATGTATVPGPASVASVYYQFGDYLLLGNTVANQYINYLDFNDDTLKTIDTGTSRSYLSPTALGTLKEISGINNDILDEFGVAYTNGNLMYGFNSAGAFVIEDDNGDLLYDDIIPDITTNGKWSYIAYADGDIVYCYPGGAAVNYIMKVDMSQRTGELITIENVSSAINWGYVIAGAWFYKNDIIGDKVLLRTGGQTVNGLGWLDIFSDTAEFVSFPNGWAGLIKQLYNDGTKTYITIYGVGIVACSLDGDNNIQYDLVYSDIGTQVNVVIATNEQYMFYLKKSAAGIRRIDLVNGGGIIVPGTESITFTNVGNWKPYIDNVGSKYYLNGFQNLVILDINDSSVEIFPLQVPGYIANAIIYWHINDKYIVLAPNITANSYVFDKINNKLIDISVINPLTTNYSIVDVIEDIVLYKNGTGVLNVYNILTGDIYNLNIGDSENGNNYYRGWSAALYDDNNVYNVLYVYGANPISQPYKLPSISVLIFDNDKKVMQLMLYDEVIMTLPLGGGTGDVTLADMLGFEDAADDNFGGS